jgi:hypothetical protein
MGMFPSLGRSLWPPKRRATIAFDGRCNGARERGPNRLTRLDLDAETPRFPLD